jgi:predicted metal-dependent HD superfamily phosphohydrolase
MSDLAELATAWDIHIGNSTPSHAARDEAFGAHLEVGRVYHGLRHVTWVVRHVTTLCGEVTTSDAGAIVAAAFFHDIVYEPTLNDNEERSARVAAARLTDLGWPDDRVRTVARLVRATQRHLPGDEDIDAMVLCDADLAVLGTSPEDYGAYTSGVRREYRHVDDDAWRTGRAHVLDAFLSRDSIYQTTPAIDRWEARARANITSELVALR